MTPTLANVGGAQLYIRAKTKALTSEGWNVFCFYGSKGKITISYNNLQYLCIPQLLYQINTFSKKQINKVILSLIRFLSIDCGTHTIIESTCIDQATWAELLAKEINAKHICFLLQENNVIDRSLLAFFLFKDRRGELAGIRGETIINMFAPFVKNTESIKGSKLSAIGCFDAIDDIESPILQEIQKFKVDYIIGSIGRLEKSFVPTMLDEIYSFCSYHKELKFLILLIGAHPIKKEMQNIAKNFHKLANCSTLITGYIYPIPSQLIKKMDICIATAGSASLAYRCGVPTIAVDTNDHFPIGILGDSAKNTLFRGKDEPIIEYSTLIDEILIKKKHIRFSTVNYSANYNTHFEFIKNSDPTKEYFDVIKIQRTKRCKIRNVLISIIGINSYFHLSTFVHHFIDKR